MTEAIAEFFHKIFGDNAVLATILIAIVPLVEVKGAIPFGMSKSFWGTKALTSWQALGYSFLGSTIIVPILALVFKPIYNWLKDKKFFKSIIHFFTGDIEERTEKTEAKTKQKSKVLSIFLKMLTVFLFVAFPVPLTGVWTGTCFAVLLGLNFWQTCLSVILGNFVCSLIVTFICSIFPNATNILLYIFLAIILVAFIVKLILHFVKKHKKHKLEQSNNEENQSKEA